MHSLLTRRLTGVAVVFAALAFTVSAFAQYGGLTGRCTGEKGEPLAGYTLRLERIEQKRLLTVKTDKKGQYTYIGLYPGEYNITLLDPSGQQVFNINNQHVQLGDPTEVNIDLAKERADTMKQRMSNPETAAKAEEAAKTQKEFTGLKATFDQGTLLFNQKHYAEAAAMFEKAVPLADAKNLPAVLARLADTYGSAARQEQAKDARTQDEQKAVETYQKVLQLVPNDPGLHNNLGGVYAEMGKIDDAQKEFQKAADINPPGASTYYYNLGVVMVNQGKMDEAAVALKKATDLNPTNANAFYWYGMALLGKAETKPDGSVVAVPGTVEAFQNYLKLQPNGPWAQAAQASLDQIQGKVQTEFKKTKKKS
ncbi:MAG: tetratricopeptide repeat protein [Terriglobia bacterium]